MIIANIFSYGGPEKGWNKYSDCILTFKNERRFLFFAKYYTSKNDVLIKVYHLGQWVASYCNGEEIWNCY